MKATNQADWSIITIEGQRADGFRGKPRTLVEGPSHAGGVVVRRKNGAPEYLLVQAKNEPDRWVLPKGHIEPGETEREAAVREVLEETTVWARVEKELGDMSFVVGEDRVQVRFYLMEDTELRDDRGPPKRRGEGRTHQWPPHAEAIREASHTESQQLLTRADQLQGPNAT